MKNKKLFSCLMASALMVPALIGLGACGKKDPATQLNAKDMYAMSAISSVGYLAESGTGVQAQSAQAVQRPSLITPEDVSGIKNCLSMFDSLLVSGGANPEIQENTDTTDYAVINEQSYVMLINIPAIGTDSTNLKLYFTEKYTQTDIEVDDGILEIEESTYFDGYALYADQVFQVRGEHTYDSDDNEVSISFTTWKNKSQVAGVYDKDTDNFVVVEHSTENSEFEYEYEIHDGQDVTEFEIEYEKRRSGVEIEFEFGIEGNSESEFSYKAVCGKTPGTFKVYVEKSTGKDVVTVTENSDGTFTFKYSNNQTETV